MYIIGYVCDGSLPTVSVQDAEQLTHINLAFGHVAPDHTLETGEMKHLDLLKGIRAANPSIRIVLSVGGWGAGGFSLMSRSEEGRRRFAASCAAYVAETGLDGIDIDWEYPCSGAAGIDNDPSDKHNFTLLLQALRDALGPEKIVSIAAGAGQYFIDGTEMEQVARICDYVQLMTYDIRSGFCPQAGHHTAPFASEGSGETMDTASVAEMFVRAGVPAEKIVLGAAFYSRRWDKVAPENHGLFMKAGTVGQYGPGYTELAEKFIDKNGFVRYFDEQAQAPWLFNGSSLISYDDPVSVAAKCRHLKEKHYAGIMYWEHGCDPSKVLLRTMAEALRPEGI